MRFPLCLTVSRPQHGGTTWAGSRVDGGTEMSTAAATGAAMRERRIMPALAARVAQGDLGRSVAGRLLEVSRGGQRCTTFAQCAALLDAGVDIDYDGLSGRIEFDGSGDVGEGTFGVYTYGRDNDCTRTETRVVPS